MVELFVPFPLIFKYLFCNLFASTDKSLNLFLLFFLTLDLVLYYPLHLFRQMYRYSMTKYFYSKFGNFFTLNVYPDNHTRIGFLVCFFLVGVQIQRRHVEGFIDVTYICSGPPSVMKELLLLTEKGRCYRCQRATVEQYSLRLLSNTFIRVRQENKNYKTFLSATTKNVILFYFEVIFLPLYNQYKMHIKTVQYPII
ncbi:hypothetical protein FWK35_00022811 [Aphis craccivora]|uniref:Uncharacterized protein n=1 Tax=Aphis craccivora TaxID=307492 RepID=A0A6G0Y279_APHCR|nr:hypothetical protein FWK35_00022811 [Aphis craccivora]